MKDGKEWSPFGGGGGGVEILADANDGGIGVIAREDRILVSDLGESRKDKAGADEGQLMQIDHA
jgi:hypothetical protein